MIERERLIPFIGEIKSYEYDGLAKVTHERLFGYLLENKVSILPCKVGDILYYHDHKCGAFNDNNDEWSVVDSIVCEIRIKKKGFLVEMSSGRIFTHKEFGKIIFNTKEEAEKALVGRNEE